MSKPIVPEFVDCGFYVSCSTTMGKENSDSAYTEILIHYEEKTNAYAESFQVISGKGELYINCDGSIEGSAILELFESIVEKLRADIKENKANAQK